jgi:hypothetical protein
MVVKDILDNCVDRLDKGLAKLDSGKKQDKK